LRAPWPRYWQKRQVGSTSIPCPRSHYNAPIHLQASTGYRFHRVVPTPTTVTTSRNLPSLVRNAPRRVNPSGAEVWQSLPRTSSRTYVGPLLHAGKDFAMIELTTQHPFWRLAA
jgi:hypothetical protein